MENKIKSVSPLIFLCALYGCTPAVSVYNLTKSEPVQGKTALLYVKEKPQNGLLSLRALDGKASPDSVGEYDRSSDELNIITRPYRAGGDIFPSGEGFCGSKECCIWLDTGQHTATAAVFESFGLCNAISNNFDPVFRDIMTVKFTARAGKVYELSPSFEYEGGCEPVVSLSVVESTTTPSICFKEEK